MSNDRGAIWLLQEHGVCNIHIKFQKGIGAKTGREKLTFSDKHKFLAHPTKIDKPFNLVFQKDYLPIDIDFKKLTDAEKKQLSDFLDTHPLFTLTRQHRTKSGGRHYIFKYPVERVIAGHQKTNLFTFTDIPARDDGEGFVDIPWNLAFNDHAKASYSVINPALPLEITKEQFESLGLVQLRESLSADKLEMLGNASPGNRHNTILKIVSSLVAKGARDQKIFAFFEGHADKFAGENFNLVKEIENALSWCKERQGAQLAETPLFDVTQSGLADRIQHYYPEGHLIYNITSNSWHLYNKWFWRDNTFSPLDLVRKLAQDTLLEEFSVRAFMAAESTDDDKERAAKIAGVWKAYGAHYRECQSRDFINCALDFLKDRPGFSATESTNLDDRPIFNQKHDRINFKNTAFDFTTFSATPFDWRDYSTLFCPVEYDADAVCPTFEKMMRRILGDDAELYEWVKCFLGSCLLGGQNTDKILPVFWGSGNNGKTTIIEIMHKLLGGYATTVTAETLAYTKNKDKFGLDNLPNKRFVAAQESEHNARLDIGRVKALTGNDTQKCNRKHKREFDFKPSFKMLLSTNNKPKIIDNGEAVWSRVKLVPFTVRIPPEEAIPNLDSIIVETEGSGVINWLIEGARIWVENGRRLPKCKAIDNASQEYQEEEDVILQWVRERCIEIQDASKGTKLSDLYHDFKQTYFAIRRGDFKEGLKKMNLKEYTNAYGFVMYPLTLKETIEESGMTDLTQEDTEKKEESVF